jgi:hypothetical protein
MESNHTLLFDARAATRDFPGIDRYIRALLAALLPICAGRAVACDPARGMNPLPGSSGVTLHRVDADLTTFRSHWQTLGWRARSGRRSFMPPISDPAARAGQNWF